MRIYHNFTDDIDKLESLFQLDDHVDLCNSTQIIQNLNLGDIFAMTWRWVRLPILKQSIYSKIKWWFSNIWQLPLLDDLVEVMISRDSDTYILDRELAAVQEWMSSNEHTFHVMRDHQGHGDPIMGGE